MAGLIDERLGEVNQRLRELRAFKRELTQLRERMRTDEPVERDGPYCHYIHNSPRPLDLPPRGSFTVSDSL